MNNRKPDTLEALSLASAVLGVALILETIKSDFQHPAPWREIFWRDWLFVTLFLAMIILGIWGLKKTGDRKRRRGQSDDEKE